MIEGKLVNLRAREMSDVERNNRWMNDREVTEYLSMRYPLSLTAEEASMRGVVSKPISYGDGVYFAIDTKGGEHIGHIGLNEMSAEHRKARLGVVIGEKAYWSKGYGTDAMLTFLRFAFDEMNFHRIDLGVDAENLGAMACYRKCGFVEEVRMRQVRFLHGAYGDGIVMGILRNEFYALHGITRTEVAR